MLWQDKKNDEKSMKNDEKSMNINEKSMKNSMKINENSMKNLLRTLPQPLQPPWRPKSKKNQWKANIFETPASSSLPQLPQLSKTYEIQ